MGLMGIPKLFLQIWGIWPIDTIASPVKRKLYLVYRYVIIGWYIIFNISQATECVRLIIRKVPFERISKCLSIVLTLGTMVWESIIYFKNNIPQMCLMAMESESSLSMLDDERINVTYNKLLKKNRYVNSWLIGASLFTYFAFIYISLQDLLKAGPDFWDFDNVSFMHELYLPFEKREHYYFIIIGNLLSGSESIIVSSATQTTFYSLLLYCFMRLRIFRIRLANLDNMSKNMEDTEWNLKAFLNEHQQLIRFIEELNEATKYVVLAGYILNSIKVASVLIQVLTVLDPTVLSFPICYSFMLLTDIFLVGWMCNEIKEESLGIADTAYQILWYNESKDVKMMLQILIMRAQKPLTMTIGPFGAMTTQTIATTMKAGYSYATLLMKQKQ